MDVPRPEQEKQYEQALAVEVALKDASSTYHAGDCRCQSRSHSAMGLWQPTDYDHLISRIAQRIHRSLDLEKILTTTVEDVRQFLQTDRVLILRFDDHQSGCVAVESVAPGWNAMLGTTIRDPCFAETYWQAYRQGRIQTIADVYDAHLSPCYLELLTQFQVRANLVLPIIQPLQALTHSSESSALTDANPPEASALWGLLIAQQCQSSRYWHPLEIETLQELATQAAIAIQQSELHQQVQRLNRDLEQQVQERTRQLQQSLNFAEVLKRITDRIHASLDESHIFQVAVEALAHVLAVDYCCATLYNLDRTTATICYEATSAHLGSAIGQVLSVTDTPKVHEHLLQGNLFQAYDGNRTLLQSTQTGDLACPDLFHHLTAKLLCPIFLEVAALCPTPSSHQTATASPCRDPIWAGEAGAIGYLVVIHQTTRVFSEAEINLVRQVASQCAIAIRQARLYQAARTQVEELEKLNRLKDDFLSTVSHELRTPVASMKMAILMLTLALKNNPLPLDKASHYLQILHEQCEREISLINDLLELQRLEAGEQPLTVSEIDLQPWLTQLVESFDEQIDRHHQYLQVNLPAKLPRLMSDPASLERVLIELLGNACKYSPAEAVITLTVWRTNLGICLDVCNSHTEIPLEEIPRIFDKFYRVPNADPWKQGGTGLGLALVQKLVHHLGGSIRVKSGNHQTCFTLELPLAPD
ncbi:GAF domain-containing protein [Pantanalinema rosaneae CENA516]|uniref:sensor histidine kinase n=1 Tax=Pantanalinema rosaneae TaxID=1620701 RepID=UPI003D6EB9FC